MNVNLIDKKKKKETAVLEKWQNKTNSTYHILHQTFLIRIYKYNAILDV